MARERLPQQAKIRLLLLLALGGAIGAFASKAASRNVQLALVAAAVCVGVYAGFTIRRSLFLNRAGGKVGVPDS